MALLPTPKLEDISVRTTRERARATLDVLWMQPDHKVEEKSGRATAIFVTLLPEELRTKDVRSITMFLHDLEELKWVKTKRNAKKT